MSAPDIDVDSAIDPVRVPEIDPDGIDLSDIDGFWTEPVAHRHAAFKALRARPGLPFYAEPKNFMLPAGPGYYAVTRMDDIITASRNPKVFTSGSGATSAVDLPPEFNEFYGSMINMDDPRHARLRRIVSRGFTPRRLDALTDNVATLATRIVDDVLAAGQVDAVTDIAARLPLTIVCDLMGIPESQHDFVFDRTNVILGATDPEYVPDTDNILVALIDAGKELARLMHELAAERAERPADDLTSALLNAQVDGEALTPDELASFFILLVVAGNETTRNAISWGLHLLTEHPEQRKVWLDDLAGVTPTAVEEIVRWASPVSFMRRTVSDTAADAGDVELGGQLLKPGDKVLMFYGSGNRDANHFADPDGFDVRRSPNPHIGFGGPGPHFCLGAHLARREIAVMFRELLTRAPGIHATAPPQQLKSSFINGIKHLPVSIG